MVGSLYGVRSIKMAIRAGYILDVLMEGNPLPTIMMKTVSKPRER